MHRSAAVLLAILGLTAPSIAASWTESVNGDISGNRLIPSLLTLDLGGNAVAGSFGSGDHGVLLLLARVTIHGPSILASMTMRRSV